MNLKYELQSIISGAGKNPKRSIIEAAAHDLVKSQEPSGNAFFNWGSLPNMNRV